MPDTRTIRVVRLYADDFGESGLEILTRPILQREFVAPAGYRF
jgi:hypothetical protein